MSNRKKLRNKRAQEFEKYLDKLFTMYRDGSFNETMQTTDRRSSEWWTNPNNPNFNWYQKQNNKSPLMNPFDPTNGILKDPSEMATKNPEYFDPSYFVDPREDQELADEVYRADEIAKIQEDPQKWLAENAKEANALETVRDRALTSISRIFNYSDDADLEILGADLSGVESIWDSFTSRLIGGYDLLNLGMAGLVSAAPGGVRTLSYDELSGGYSPMEIFEGAKSAPGNENIAPSTGQIALASVAKEAARIRNGDGRLTDLALLNPATLPFVAAGYLDEDSPLQANDFDIMNPADRLEAFSSGPEKFFSGLTDAGLMFADPLIGVGVVSKVAKAGALGTPLTKAGRAKQATAYDSQMLEMLGEAGDQGRDIAAEAQRRFDNQPVATQGRAEILMDIAQEQGVDLTQLFNSVQETSTTVSGWRTPLARFAWQVTRRGENGEKTTSAAEILRRRELKNNPNAGMMVQALDQTNDPFTALMIMRASTGDQAALRVLGRIDGMMADQYRQANAAYAIAAQKMGGADQDAALLFQDKQIALQNKRIARLEAEVDAVDSQAILSLERERAVLREMEDVRSILKTGDTDAIARLQLEGLEATDPEAAKRLVAQLMNQRDAQGRIIMDRLAQARSTYTDLDFAYKTNFFARGVMASRERAARSAHQYSVEGTSIFPRTIDKVENGVVVKDKDGKIETERDGWFTESTQGVGRFRRAVRIWRWAGEENPVGFLGLKGTSTVRQEREINAMLQGLDVYRTNTDRANELRQMLLASLNDPAADAYEAVRVFEREIFADMQSFYGLDGPVDELLKKMQSQRDSWMARHQRDADGAYGITEDGGLEFNPWLEVHAANGTFVLNFDELAKAFRKVASEDAQRLQWDAMKGMTVQAFNDIYGTFNNLWRPATLLRASYTQRNVFEGTIRAMAYTHSLRPLVWPAQAAVNWGVNRSGILRRRHERAVAAAKKKLEEGDLLEVEDVEALIRTQTELDAVDMAIRVAREGNEEPLRVVIQASRKLLDDGDEPVAGGAFLPDDPNAPVKTVSMAEVHVLNQSKPVPQPPKVISDYQPAAQDWIDYLNEPIEGRIVAPRAGLTQGQKDQLAEAVTRIVADQDVTAEEAVSLILSGGDNIDPRLTTIAQQYIRDTDSMPSVARGVQVGESTGLVGFGSRSIDEMNEFDDALDYELNAQYETGTTSRVNDEVQQRRDSLPEEYDRYTGLSPEDHDLLRQVYEILKQTEGTVGVPKSLVSAVNGKKGSLSKKKWESNSRFMKALDKAGINRQAAVKVVLLATKFVEEIDELIKVKDLVRKGDKSVKREGLTTETIGGRPSRVENDSSLIGREEGAVAETRRLEGEDALREYERTYEAWVRGNPELMDGIESYATVDLQGGHPVQVKVLKRIAREEADRKQIDLDDLPPTRSVTIPNGMPEFVSPGGSVAGHVLPPKGKVIRAGDQVDYVTFMYAVMKRQNDKSMDHSGVGATFIMGGEVDGSNAVLAAIADQLPGASVQRVGVDAAAETAAKKAVARRIYAAAVEEWKAGGKKGPEPTKQDFVYVLDEDISSGTALAEEISRELYRQRDWRMRNNPNALPHEAILFQGRNAQGEWSSGIGDAARGAGAVERRGSDGSMQTTDVFALAPGADKKFVVARGAQGQGQRPPIPTGWYRLDGDNLQYSESGMTGRRGTETVRSDFGPLIDMEGPARRALQAARAAKNADKQGNPVSVPDEFEPAPVPDAGGTRSTSGGPDVDAILEKQTSDLDVEVKPNTKIITSFDEADEVVRDYGTGSDNVDVYGNKEQDFGSKGQWGTESLIVDFGEMTPRSYGQGRVVTIRGTNRDGTPYERTMGLDQAITYRNELLGEVSEGFAQNLDETIAVRLDAVRGTKFGDWWDEQIVALRAQRDAYREMIQDLESADGGVEGFGPMLVQLQQDHMAAQSQLLQLLLDPKKALVLYGQQGKRRRAIGSGVSKNADGSFYGDGFHSPLADINRVLASAEMTTMQKLSLRYDTTNSIFLRHLGDSTVPRAWEATNRQQIIEGLVRNIEQYSSSELVQVIFRAMDADGAVDVDQIVAWMDTPQGQEWYLTSRMMFDADEGVRKDATDVLTSGEKKRKDVSEDRIEDPAMGIIGSVQSKARGAETPFIPASNRNEAIFEPQAIRKFIIQDILPRLDRSVWDLAALRDLMRRTAQERAAGAQRIGTKGGNLGLAPDRTRLTQEVAEILDNLPTEVSQFMRAARGKEELVYPQWMVDQNPRLKDKTPPKQYMVQSDEAILASESKITKLYSTLIRRAFNLLGTMPEDAFVRMPFYNTQYKRARDLMIRRYWDEQFEPTPQQLSAMGIENMSEWRKLQTKGGKNATGKAVSQADGTILIPRRTLAQIETAAHRQALNNTREWMFTIDRRTNLGKYGEYFFPFISATQNSVTVIGKLLARDPWLGPFALNVYRAPEKMGLVDEDNNILIPKANLPGSKWFGALDDNSFIKINRDGLNTLFPPTGYGFVPRLGPMALVPASEAMKHGLFPPDTPKVVTDVMGEKAGDQFYQEVQKYIFGEDSTFSDKPFSWDMFMPSTAQRFMSMTDETNAAYGYAYNMARAREMNKWARGDRDKLPSDSDIEEIVRAQMWFAAMGSFGIPTPATPYPILTRPQIGTPEEVVPELLRLYMDADQKAGGTGNPAADFQENFGYLMTEQGMAATTAGQGGMAPQLEAVTDAKRFGPLIDDVAENISNYGVLGIITNNRTTMGEYDQSARQWQKVNYIPGRSIRWRENLTPEEQTEEAQRVNGWISYRRRMDSLDAQLFSLGLRNYQQNGAAPLKAQKDQFIQEMVANPNYKGWTKDYEDAGAGKKRDALATIRMSISNPEFRDFMLENNMSGTLGAMDEYIAARNAAGNMLREVEGGINAPENARIKAAWLATQDELRMRDLRFAEIFDLYLSGDENPAEMSGLPGVVTEREARQ